MDTKPSKIKNICFANKRTIKICDKKFWNEKLKKDAPLLIGLIANNYNDYENIINAYTQANQQISNIINDLGFFFKVDNHMTWLPNDLLQKTLTKKQQKHVYQLVIYNADVNHYWITPAFATYPRNKDNIDLDKKETVTYITKLFYYNPEQKWELIEGG